MWIPIVPVPGGSSPAQGLTCPWPALNTSLIWGQMPGSGAPVPLLLKTEFRMPGPSSTRVLPRAARHYTAASAVGRVAVPLTLFSDLQAQGRGPGLFPRVAFKACV